MKLEAVFEVDSVRVGRNCGKNAVVLAGRLTDTSGYGNDSSKDGPLNMPEIALVVHTEDGQSPVKLGAKLKVTFTDEGL